MFQRCFLVLGLQQYIWQARSCFRGTYILKAVDKQNKTRKSQIVVSIKIKIKPEGGDKGWMGGRGDWYRLGSQGILTDEGTFVLRYKWQESLPHKDLEAKLSNEMEQ